jgi:Fur family ferric uptake transcriptional regulator
LETFSTIAIPQRQTRQRQVILEELRAVTSHPSASEIYEMARKRLPRLSLGTVYRDLDQLTEAGEILRLTGNGRQTRYDGNAAPHLHVRCIHCGRIGDVNGATMPKTDLDVQAADGFHILGCEFQFTGLCPDCADIEHLGDGQN